MEKKRVLIVDDDADFVDMNKTVLEAGGYDVDVAYSGKEGLQQAGSHPPDVILLDMMMETWAEGTKVVDKLRAAYSTKDIPIIFISAVNMRSRVGDVADPEGMLGVDRYVVKPVTPEKLLDCVREVAGD